MRKKLIVLILIVLVLTAAGYLILLRGSTQKYDFRFDKVTMGDITMSVTATGSINAVTSVDVGTQVSGIISKLYADFNSIVKEGQVIAQIDTTFLVQSVKDAEANLYRAKAQIADSKRALDREKVLLEKGLEPQINYDAAQTTYESNEAALKQAEATLERAKINLAYATIFAPINGVVIDRKVNVGQTVAASFSSPTLYTIANDLSKMQVLTTVDESDIGRISIGQEATFTVDAYTEETFKGTISQIRLAPVSIQNVVNYTVVIDVNNDQLKLMPGMTANVKIKIASSHNVLRVPNMAIRFQPPSEVIDTTRLIAPRENPAQGSGIEGDYQKNGVIAPNDSNSSEKTGVQHRGLENNRKLFQAIKDSLISAHNGNVNQEELQKKIQKIFIDRKNAQQMPAQPIVQRQAQLNKGTKFGIIQTFPEYEKSAYIPQHQAARARIWILNSKGKLEPVFVQTGITDGKYTEITTSGLKAGDQIVMGIISSSNVASSQTQNPLTGGGQQRPMGGGGFR